MIEIDTDPFESLRRHRAQLQKDLEENENLALFKPEVREAEIQRALLEFDTLIARPFIAELKPKLRVIEGGKED